MQALLLLVCLAALCAAQDLSGIWNMGPFSVPAQLLYVQVHNTSFYWPGDVYSNVSFDVRLLLLFTYNVCGFRRASNDGATISLKY